MVYRRTAEEQARLDAVRDRIVGATTHLVAEGGWGAAPIAAVARGAGVATGTVYRHVRDKDELFAEVFRRAAGLELAHVTEAARTTAPAQERIAGALRTFAARALRSRRLAHALLTEPAGTVIEAERLTHRAGYHGLFADVLREGVAAGELPPHDHALVAAVLVGAMAEALVGPLAPVAAGDPDPGVARRTDDLVAACLRALPTHASGEDPP